MEVGSDSELSSDENEQQVSEDEEERHWGWNRNENIDDEAFEVSEEQAKEEDDAIPWEQYGSGYETNDCSSSGSVVESDSDSYYYTGKDGPPLSDDEGYYYYEEIGSGESACSDNSSEGSG